MKSVLSLALVALAASASAIPTNKSPKYNKPSPKPSTVKSYHSTTTTIRSHSTTTTARPYSTTTVKPYTTTTSTSTSTSTIPTTTTTPFPYPQPTPPNYSVPGYTGSDLHNGAILAPTDPSCYTFITEKTWNDGQPFSPQRCVDACEAETKFNQEYLNSRATCRFVNTYILFKNGVPQSQVCAMYTHAWGVEYATNTGYTSGKDKFTIGESWSYGNASDPGDEKSVS